MMLMLIIFMVISRNAFCAFDANHKSQSLSSLTADGFKINNVVFSPDNKIIGVEAKSSSLHKSTCHSNYLFMYNIEGSLLYKLPIKMGDIINNSFCGFVNSGKNILIMSNNGFELRNSSDGSFISNIADHEFTNIWYIGSDNKSIISFAGTNSNNKPNIYKWNINTNKRLPIHSTTIRIYAHGMMHMLSRHTKKIMYVFPYQKEWFVNMELQYLAPLLLVISPDNKFMVLTKPHNHPKIVNISTWKAIFEKGDMFYKPFKLYCNPLKISQVMVSNPSFSDKLWSSKGWDHIKLPAQYDSEYTICGLANKAQYVVLSSDNNSQYIVILKMLKTSNQYTGVVAAKLHLK